MPGEDRAIPPAIPVVVTLRDCETGELAMHTTELWPDDDDGVWLATLNTFIWAEGNFSCDCNRSLFFARALRRPEPDSPKCGETRYSASICRADTGEHIYGPDRPLRVLNAR